MNAEFPFSLEQKEYLAGFFAGASQRGVQPRLAPDRNAGQAGNAAPAASVFGVPIDELSKEERVKWEKNGLDCYEDIVSAAADNSLPEGADAFRFKYYGLFNVSPAQESLMLRCRIAAGILSAHQLEGLGRMAEEWAGGYAHITTRANLQLREIEPKNAIRLLEGLADLGLTSRGAGADNLRNITASPTAGFDPNELYDTRELAKAMHHLILNTREFYGLPRKFNIAFDGGGAVSACADTNDLAFYAVRVPEGEAAEPGVYFRVQIAGITGHRQFAKDCGILIPPDKCLAVAAAMIRVFIEHGDRTSRKKARLKYLIDRWGEKRFLEETQKKLGFPLSRFPLERCQGRGPVVPHGHLGAGRQAQEGLWYVGIGIPVGRMSSRQMLGLAQIAQRFGQGELRLTVWQNLLIPHVPQEQVSALMEDVRLLGFSCDRDSIRGGLVACTGSSGCKYASADTKANAVELGDYLAERLKLEEPINIHLTGCPHSCAQHYIGDIGLQAVKVRTERGLEEGYHVALGGGVEDRQAIAIELFKSVPFDELKPLLLRVLSVYLEQRESGESFQRFNRSRDPEQLKALYGAVLQEA